METFIGKLTASLLLTLMMAVAATSQGGVLYCQCLHTLTVGSCGCEVVDKDHPADHSGSGVEDHSCHCCQEVEPVDESRPAVGPHDCNVELILALGDFCETSPSFPVFDEVPGVDTLGRTEWENETSSVCAAKRSCSCRPPPDHRRLHSVPLYLRDLVFLV